LVTIFPADKSILNSNLVVSENLRSCELNEEYSKFKSYSLDPFPDCQMKKRVTDSFRKHKKTNETTETSTKTDCNGGVKISQSQRSDHVPLLVSTNRKRWHSLEIVGSSCNADIDGCEELVDRNSKKSLGRQVIKKWLVEFFQSNGLKNSPRNNSGILLQSTTSNQKMKPEETSIV
jgi:hypothetical protein